MKYMKYIIIIFGLLFFCLLSYSVVAETWYSESFGGSVTITENNIPTFSDNSPTGIRVELHVDLSIVVTDDDGDETTVYWKIDTDSNVNDTGVAHINTSVLNGTAYYNDSVEVDSYSTTYYVGVWANDTHDNSSIFWSFTTDDESGDITTWYVSSFGGSVTITSDYPYVYDESPTNGSTGESILGTLSINVTEYQGQNFNITWQTNESGSWVNFAYNSSCDNGTYSQDIDWSDTGDTTYWWNVSVNDTDGNWNNQTYHFTTGSYGWNNWSAYWCIGKTSKYDVTLDMTVDVFDVSSVCFYYDESGDPGWISQDINTDGKVDYFDIGGVGVHYGEDYT